MGDPQQGQSISSTLLEVRDLSKYFALSSHWLRRVVARQSRPVLKAIDGVSFRIRRGQTFGLVGESGCGKSTVARVIVGLHTPTGGEILFEDKLVNARNDRYSRASLQSRMQMIFQDPYASLDPRWRVRSIIAEPSPGLSNSPVTRQRFAGVSPNCSARSVSPRATVKNIPTNSAAASVSAFQSPERSPATPLFLFATIQPPPLMCRFRRKFST